MFNNKRRVDLGGRKGPNRRKLIEDSRRHRAARLKEQRERAAATKIQAFVRRVQDVSRAKERMRSAWSAKMKATAKGKLSLTSKALAEAVREFVFFFSWAKDSARLTPLCRLVCQSVQAPLDRNFLGFLAAADEASVRSGVARTNDLLGILLSFVRERMEPSNRIGMPLATLLCLVDTRRVPHLAKASAPVAARFRRNHLRIIKSLSHAEARFFESIVVAFRKLARASKASGEQPMKLVAATLMATSLRPVIVWPASDEKIDQSQSPHRQFSSNVLAVPFLRNQLQALQLDKIADNIGAKKLWLPFLAAMSDVKRGRSLDSAALQESVPVDMDRKLLAPRALMMLGNVLEIGLGTLGKLSLEEKSLYFAAVHNLVLHIDRIPDDTHPMLKRQLSVLQEKKFLDSMCDCVKNLPPPKCHIVFKLLSSLCFKFNSIKTPMLNALVFSSSIITELYNALIQAKLAKIPTYEWNVELREMFALFCICYHHLLLIQDDSEFFEAQKPCTLAQIAGIVKVIRSVLYTLYWEGGKRLNSRDLPSGWMEHREENWSQHREVATELFRQLRVRQSRRQFCSPDIWIMSNIPFGIFKQELDFKAGSRATRILQKIPFVLTFQQRVELFYGFIRDDQKHLDGAGVNFQHGAGVMLRVRRDLVLTDGFEGLSKLGNQIKGRVQVQFINQHGIPESGIDGGGLFKEFVTELLRAAFDPQLGLFKQTAHEFTYPNPTSHANPNFSNHLAYFQFVGMIVGKCLYDGIILEPQFANFFLRKLLGYRNFVDDLGSLDTEVYKNLLYLKNNSAEGLGLTFSVARDVFGDSKVVDLIPNGSEIEVTDKNRLRFIYEMADFKLNREIAQQSNAFVAGLNYIIRPDWLRMFEAEELDRLISGTPVIDLADLRRNTNYTGGYDENHEIIRWFWSILDNEFDEKERRSFLKFSTSVSRSPLLGFRHLYPKFCIQRSSGDSENLPTSSTCMNLLKLPRYNSREKLLEKLKYSIQSASGFYLT